MIIPRSSMMRRSAVLRDDWRTGAAGDKVTGAAGDNVTGAAGDKMAGAEDAEFEGFFIVLSQLSKEQDKKVTRSDSHLRGHLMPPIKIKHINIISLFYL